MLKGDLDMNLSVLLQLLLCVRAKGSRVPDLN